MIKFTVYGVPQPQGSTRAFIPKGWSRPIITSANAKLKPWRQEVSGAALAALERLAAGLIEPWKDPIAVSIDFYFDRPKSVKSMHKTTKPDIDKLERGVFDALTGIIFKDDSQVVRSAMTKQFGSPARAEISIEVLP